MGGTRNVQITPDAIMARLRMKDGYEDLGRGATDEEIRSVERTLDVALPSEYRDFLSRCGYAFWFGISIFGVAPSSDDSVIHWTEKARGEKLPGAFAPRPHDAVVVHDYGGGGYYFLFDSRSPRAGEVVLLADETLGSEVQRYPNFWTFLAMFAR